ncbi:unnamed protein product [Macrosiphum euphorbiae]|uniref:Uncharacterized protein n=1 Tax=Macrosiphum euphorbiae TaxID=13131 RepID=A0AAV0VU45_9HEMI|nr:unnamed protein product [Macrosiphum euphorbiae]
MMHSFRKILILYAQTSEEAQEKYVETMNIKSNYPMWQKYITVHHWKCKEKWCLAWRDHTNRGHQTNNFSKVSVRIFKENVLGCVKAYNVISLIDFCCTKLVEYYKNFFLEFSNERNSTAQLFFKNLIKKTDYITKEEITVDNEEFYVPITIEDKYFIAKLALGEKVPNKTFYEGLLPTEVIHEQSLVSHDFHQDIDYGDDANKKSSTENPKHRNGASIKVQPTTIARRRPWVTRGSKRLLAGRPATTDSNRPKKKPRNLQRNIRNCVTNSKSH